MNPQAVVAELEALLQLTRNLGGALQAGLLMAAAVLGLTSLIPALRSRRRRALVVTTILLALGELLLVWFHWRLSAFAIVADPSGRIAGHVAVPLWIESEKLYIWALVVAVMGLFARDHRDELASGVGIVVAVLTIGAVFWGKPFTNPLPGFLGQYVGYLQAMASGNAAAAQAAFEGMEGARRFYYNSWYMWIHPPLLFLAYGAFTMAFLATLLTISRRHSSYERLAYHWARLGYLPLTAGMLLGFPWAITAWRGESWWWSGKVNMSIMMWLLYTAYLHGRLYLRHRGMWRWVVALSVLSFVILVLTYLATYVVPGAHSYA